MFFLDFLKKRRETKKILIILGLVLILGAFLRLYKIGQQSFIADEFLGINASYGYAQTGQWKFWDFNQGKLTEEDYTRANVYYWQVAQLWNWLDLGEGNSRLISVGWGLLGILAVFGLVYYFFGSWQWAILAALFLAVSPGALTFDRKLRMYSMFAPVFLAFSLSLYLLLESRAQKIPAQLKKIQEKTGLNFVFLPLVFLLGGLSLATHLLTVNIFPIAAAYLLTMAILSYWETGKLGNRYSVYLLSMAAVVLVAVQLKEIRDSLNFFSWVSNWSYFEKMIFDYSHPLLAVVFLLAGIYFIVGQNRKLGLWLAINFLAILFLAAFIWKRNAGLQYLYFITPFKVIIFSGGVYFISNFLSEKISSGSRRAFWGWVVFFFLLLPNWGFFLSGEGFYRDIKKWDLPNYREVYGYYLENRQGNAAIVARPLVSYYLRDSASPVIDYGVSNPLTLDRVVLAQGQYDQLWVIFSKDTYIKSDAERYIRENFELIKTKYTNDTLLIYVWRK